ncbi:MAG: hypothetical protein ACRYHQ_26635, partial [Janthinobacterium lividum]
LDAGTGLVNFGSAVGALAAVSFRAARFVITARGIFFVVVAARAILASCCVSRCESLLLCQRAPST